MYTVFELPEFLAAVSGATNAQAAQDRGVALIAETFGAEVVAVIEHGEVLASVGYPRGAPAPSDLVEAAQLGTNTLEIPGSGPATASLVQIGGPDCVIVMARAGAPLTSAELAHAQAMARVLSLALRLLDKIDENKNLLSEQRAYQAVLEAILRVQRLTSQRRPIETILEAICHEAVSLLGADLAGLHLQTARGPSQRSLATATEAGMILSYSLPETEFATIGKRAQRSDLIYPTPAQFKTRSGEIVDTMLVGAPVFDDGVRVGGMFVVVERSEDIEWEVDLATIETFASQASIALTDANTMIELQHAFHDHLTGLPNRALFHDRFEHAVELAARTGTMTGLLFVDLDGFKGVNDTLGHAAGDALLREVSEQIQSVDRACDSVARIGGDEFAIVLEDTSEAGAEAVAQRLLSVVGRVVNPTGSASAGASIGVALSDPGCSSTDELLRRADIAMYSVKSTGRGGVAFYDAAMGATRLDQNAVTDALQLALVRDEFTVHYQPIYELRHRRISGVEALVRWEDPARGLVPPGMFIGSAEQSGLIVPIGRRVLETACEQVAKWRRDLATAADMGVSVNISARQLEHGTIEDDVRSALAESGLDPAALTLEVTESIFVDDAERAGEQLRALKRHGLRLAIDDFGTGFSSLGYIHRYPFDVLKIDRTFVQGVGTSANDGAVVRTMIALAQQLSMPCVAEGIETAGELAQLRALRCSHGQGFLFSKPKPSADLERLLADAPDAMPATTP